MSYKLTLRGDNAIKGGGISREINREENSRRLILIPQKAPIKISKCVRENDAIETIAIIGIVVPGIGSLSDE